MEDSEFLQWIHNRIVHQYGEDKDIDFLIRLRTIIANQAEQEKSFSDYLNFIETKK